MTESTPKHNQLGSILIQKDAIASIARQSTLQSYGVVGLAPKNIIENILNKTNELSGSLVTDLNLEGILT